MRAAETKLEMLRRHVQEGEYRLVRQRALIARLREYGLPTAEAENFLAAIEELQRQSEAHLASAEVASA